MSEQDIIAQYFSRHQSCPDVEIGIGDDAAVVIPPKNAKLVVTTDTLNEGVHFYPDCIPEHVGHKALAVNLSDLAAMGATPLWATINLSIHKIEHEWLDKFTQGLYALADQHRIKIIGGDLVKGNLSITIQAIGSLRSDKVLTRSNAKVDNLIYVTGTIGDAALGLKLHEMENNLNLSPSELNYIVSRLEKPEPRIEQGVELVEIATAASDISDGLLMDLQHIVSMSKVGAIIDIEKIPLSDVMQKQIKSLKDWSMPLSGGEDYEIIFTADKKYSSMIDAISAKTKCSITSIGHIVKGKGIKVVQKDSYIELPAQYGFDHFT